MRIFVCSIALACAVGCRAPARSAVASATVSLNHHTVFVGGPLEITYTFVVADQARFSEDYAVMLNVIDANHELVWTDNHQPPTPTTSWTAGSTIQYTRTVFVPLRADPGDFTLQVGLYSLGDEARLPLIGTDVGGRAYDAGRLRIEHASDSAAFTDGWHDREVAEHDPSVEWRWTKGRAVLAFKNPRRDATLYLHLDNPGDVFEDTQHVDVTMGVQRLAEFDLVPKQQQVRKIALKAADMGPGDAFEVRIAVDKTFVPAQRAHGSSEDQRELGVRVFHAFVEPD